jgi:polyphenol oxidase
MQWHESAGVRWLQADLRGARVAFSTRVGGVSCPPYDSLNLGLLTDDDSDNVVANRHRLAAALNLDPARVVIGRQVHGAELALHRGRQQSNPFALASGEIPAVDGHVTSEPGLALLVLVADCLPVALSGPGGVAILHCGWRGLGQGILARGAAAVGATHAAIGPGIGPCCYEVGTEVRNVFADIGPRIGSGSMLDLVEIARVRLAEAGVDSVESAGICTSCEEPILFSHRRDGGKTGRQAGIAWIHRGPH